jgi:hypothetical protein
MQYIFIFFFIELDNASQVNWKEALNSVKNMYLITFEGEFMMIDNLGN